MSCLLSCEVSGGSKMEPAGLLSLPVEVLHHVSKFLSVKEVLACSATCHYLRCAFNDNIVWKKYIPEKIQLDLQRGELSLEPEYNLKETLTPLCEKRVTFMRKTHLLNNWKSAKFVKDSTETSYWYASGVFNVSKVVGQAIYKDRYLFLGRFVNDIESDAIEVWDINKEPVLLMVLEMDEFDYSHIYIVGDCLVIVECVQVKVYEIKISEKALPLLFSFLTTGNDAIFHEPYNHPWRHDCRCVGWSYSLVDNYLFASQCQNEPHSSVFYVWDIVNACKVGSFIPPIPGFSIKYCSHKGNKWFLQMNKQSGSNTYFFQFDFERKSFSEKFILTKKNIFHSMVHNSCLIVFRDSDFNPEGWCGTTCSVIDFNTTQKLQERSFNNSTKKYQLTSTKVINGQFVILCVDGFQVIDALTLETLHQFADESVHFITHHLNILGSVFIIGANTRNIFEIWDVANKAKIAKDITEVYTSHLYLNSSCTKLVCVGSYSISVHHFL